MRAALLLEQLIQKLQDAKVSAALIAEIKQFYKTTYGEAYEDGKCDCEEKQMNQENDDA
jgi:hypothetical protein